MASNKKGTALSEVHVWKFVTWDVPAKPNLAETRDVHGHLVGETVEEWLRHEYFGIHMNNNLLSRGVYQIRGWQFDFRPYLKKFLVKQYGSIQEYWAPNKTVLRKCIYGRIEWIQDFVEPRVRRYA